MKKDTLIIILEFIFIFIMIGVGIWYWCFADCEIIKNFLWGTGSVPARCIQIK
jgi:hypothetical protein